MNKIRTMINTLLISSLFGDNLSQYYNHLTTFNSFQEKFNKTYNSVIEFETRFSIFRENLQTILSHKSHTYKLEINKFSDLTPQEFKTNYIGSGFNLNDDSSSLEFSFKRCSLFNYSLGSLYNVPDLVDWVKAGAVTPVKNQGQCGSCWTFSTTGAMEGAWTKKTGKLVSLSEQQLVDCAGGRYGNHGCNGGLMDNAFKYIADNGISSEETYPYTSGVKPLINNKCNSTISISILPNEVVGCYDVQPNNQLALKQAVALYGPVSVAIEADMKIFQSYSSGVVTDMDFCGQNLDHGVLVVGYGTENGLKYWLVKNSWGPDWGINGYIKLGRSELSDDAGVCGIAKQASFPLV